jgi:tetratricopeptide (TPR) repeat protein
MKTTTQVWTAIVMCLAGALGLLNLSNCSLGRSAGYGTEAAESSAPKHFTRNAIKRDFLSRLKTPRETPDDMYARARFFQERNKHKLAIGELKKILQIDPTYVKAYNGLGVSYDALGEYQRAIEAYTRALELSPDLDYVNNNLGYCYFLKGDFDAAIARFNKAISLDSTKSLYHKNLALAHAAKGNFDPALAELKQAGEEAKAHYTMGRFYYAKGLYPEARSQFAEAKVMNPALRGVDNYLDALDVVAPAVQAKDRDDTGPTALAATKGSRLSDEHDRRFRERDRGQTRVPGAGNDIKALVTDAAGVEVSNGNGVRHMARDVGRMLSSHGVRVVALTNATHFRYPVTTVYYLKGYREYAVDVARNLPGLQNVKESDRPARPNAKIRVLIGRDLVSQKVRLTEG